MLGRRPTDADLEWVDPTELEPPDDPIGSAIRAGNARYGHALATADADALCELFEPDGAIVDGDGPDTEGHDGLRDMALSARERFAGVTFAIDVEWTKADPRDADTAYASGTWRMSFASRGGPAAGEVRRVHGRFAQVWHRGSLGAWRLHRDLTLSREPDAPDRQA